MKRDNSAKMMILCWFCSGRSGGPPPPEQRKSRDDPEVKYINDQNLCKECIDGGRVFCVVCAVRGVLCVVCGVLCGVLCGVACGVYYVAFCARCIVWYVV